MKVKTFLYFSLIALSFSAIAEESNLTSMVTTEVFSVEEGKKAEDIICISQKWHKEDHVVSTLLDRLVDKDSEAMNHQREDSHCFDKASLSSDGQDRLVQILNRINQITNSKIAVPVELKGLSVSEGLNAIHTQHDLTVNVQEVETDKLRNSDKKMGTKLLRGSALMQGSQVLGLGILMVLPKSITKWDDNMLTKVGKSFKRAWTQSPVWDKDEFYINYIGHPYAGGMYYNAMISQGASPLTSFIFSTGQSLFWEYGPEAMFERPSVQDILFTSTIGSV